MRRRAIIFFLATLCCATAQALQAGAARVEITPPLGTPLNGYYDRLGRGAISVHDPVWARCLFLDDGDTKLFLVCMDLCVINRELRDRVMELAPNVVPPEHIILTATHTHSAQGAMCRQLLFRSVAGRFMPEVLESTAEAIAESMRVAHGRRKRATLGYGTATQETLSANRRHEGGPTDPQIGVLRVQDSDGRPIAILANFAAHPTSVPMDGEDALAVSADYPGFFYDTIEGLYGADCVAMFANGAEGNQTTANPEGKTGWARTESVGRLLAESIKAVADVIECREATLHVGYATPTLPPTLADSLLPDSTVLHTLEVDQDLLMTFFPGEPCVEIGLEMRRRAIASGYGTHFAVGLADDHLLYFIPQAFYSHMHYESGMNFYGPRIEDWFYREFSKLMTRTDTPPGPEEIEPGPVRSLPGASHVALTGDAYTIGYRRGAAFREAIQDAFDRYVRIPCDTGAIIPATGLWGLAPSFIDQTPLALPRLAIGARPLLSGIPDDVFREIEGVADGANVSFDAAWLVQCSPTFAARANTEDRYRSPFCTMFAAVGDRAGADGLRIGRNLDWPVAEAAVLADVRPTGGRRFMQVGFTWNVGSFTGMNDAGLVLCAERVESLGEPSIDGPPIELVLRALLQSVTTMEDALAALSSATHLRGYHVLVAEPSAADARVVELGDTQVVREPVDGLLLGADPAATALDEDTRRRYARVQELLAEKRIIPTSGIAEVLSDCLEDVSDPASVFNANTRHSVVFVPQSLEMHVAFPEADGTPGVFTTVSFHDDAVGEAP